MNASALFRAGQLCLSSYAPNATVGTGQDKFTFKVVLPYKDVTDSSISNLQPLSIQLTHNFPNVSEYNNVLTMEIVDASNVSTTITLSADANYQYDIDGIVEFLNTFTSLGDVFEYNSKLHVLQTKLVTAYNGYKIFVKKSTSTMWHMLGFPDTSDSFQVYYGTSAPVQRKLPFSPNLRGPECIFVSINGLSLNSSLSNTKVSTGHKVFEQNDDLNIHYCIPINCEYGGVIQHSFEDTYSNSVIFNDFTGKLQTNYTVSLYDHKRRLLRLHPDGVANLFFKQHYCP